MSRPREYKVTPFAAKAAREIGLCGNIANRLSRMARRSAPITCGYGNRRFQDFVLLVEGDEILNVVRLDFGVAAE